MILGKATMRKDAKDRLWTKNFILISLINFLLFLSSNMVNPVMSKYIVSGGINIGLAGTIVGSYAIAALFIHPFCGILLDRWSKKGLFMAAMVLMILAIIGYGVSSSVAMLFVCRLMHGGAFAMTSTAIMAILSENVAESRMGEGVGYFGLTTVIVTSFAPSLGIFLGQNYGYVYSFYCAAAAVLVALVMILFVTGNGKKDKKSAAAGKKVGESKGAERETGKEEGTNASQQKKSGTEVTQQTKTDSRKKSLSGFIFNRLLAKEVLMLSFIASLFSFANGIESSFIVLYAEQKGIAGIGSYFTVSAAAVLTARIFSGRIYDRKGIRFVILPALAIGAIGMFSLSLAGSILIFWFGAFCKGYGQGCGQPAMQTKALQLAGKERRGVASSTYYLFPDVMQSLGPAAGGWIIAGFGYESLFVVSGVMLAMGIWLYIGYEKKMG